MSDNEEVVYYDGRIPTSAFFGSHGCLYMLLFGWNLGWLEAWLSSIASHVRLTSQRILITRGLISRKEEDIPLYRVTDCAYRQTIVGRMLEVGVIKIISGDKFTARITIPFVNPQDYKELIRNAMMNERKRMRTINVD